MINAYMVDPLTIVRNNGYDSWEEPLADTNFATKGLIDYKTRLVKDIKGEEVVSMASVLLHEDTETLVGRALTHEDWITFGGVKHAIITVGKPKPMGFSGLFYKVYVA